LIIILLGLLPSRFWRSFQGRAPAPGAAKA